MFRVAFMEPEVSITLTYRELLAWARLIALQITEAFAANKLSTSSGICSGVLLVALHLDRSSLALAAILGVWEAGGAYIPVPKDIPLPRRRALFSDAALVLTDTMDDGMADSHRIVLLETSRMLVSDSNGQTTKTPDPDHVCMVVYTSGSTGRPKGVVCDHRCLWHSVRCFTKDLGEENCRRLLWKTPYQWRTAEYELYPALCLGGCIFITPDGSQTCLPFVTDALNDYAISALAVVPSVLVHMVEPISSIGSLTNVVAVGEPLPRHLCCKALQAQWQLRNYYGLTETAMTTWHCAALPESVIAPVGRPQNSAHVTLLDEDAKTARQGEVFFSGIMFRGYLHMPELTAERLWQAGLW